MLFLNVFGVIPLYVSTRNNENILSTFIFLTSAFSTLDYHNNRRNIIYKWIHYFGVSGILYWVCLNYHQQCLVESGSYFSLYYFLLFVNIEDEKWLMFAWRSLAWVFLSVYIAFVKSIET